MKLNLEEPANKVFTGFTYDDNKLKKEKMDIE